MHRDAVKAVRDLHRLFVVGDHKDLGVADGLLDETVEEQDVRVVERRVDLVQEEEGDGAVEEDGEDQRNRRHGFLAAGQEGDALGPFPGDPDLDVDARFEQVALVGQPELGAAAGEEAGEDLLEALVDPLEGFRKPFSGNGVDPGDRCPERCGSAASRLVPPVRGIGRRLSPRPRPPPWYRFLRPLS